MSKRSKQAAQQTPAEEEHLHPMRETRNHHTDDILLRASGFVIRSRRVDEEPIWERDGKLYGQSMALRMVERAKFNGGRIE